MKYEVYEIKKGCDESGKAITLKEFAASFAQQKSAISFADRLNAEIARASGKTETYRRQFEKIDKDKFPLKAATLLLDGIREEQIDDTLNGSKFIVLRNDEGDTNDGIVLDPHELHTLI